jgi:hypothetical protein
MITGCRGKQDAIGGQGVEAQQPQFIDQRNQGMKDLLVIGFSNAHSEIGECCLTGNPIFPKSRQTAIIASTIRIPEDLTEILDRSNPFEITKQVEQKQRNEIMATPSEVGIGIGGNGADEGEIDNGSYQLGDAATNGTIFVYVDEFLSKFVKRKPAGLFLG